jgi:DNA-binding CsgD family transcriptional regulator
MMKDRRQQQIIRQVLISSFQLTPAEARIAFGIACGEKLTTIAKVHGVAVTTAKTQLQSVFKKTGTHRQAELAAMLAPFVSGSERFASLYGAARGLV